MVLTKVRAGAPATVGNVACGFDVFGLAIDAPCDEVIATRKDAPGVRLSSIIPSNVQLPMDVDKNTASVAAGALLKDVSPAIGIELELIKNLPLASGLGSSASSAVAALVAVNKVLGEPLTRREMLPYAMKAEQVACGTAHADNVAPSMLGGFTIVRSADPLDVVSVPTPKNLCCVVVHPQIKVETRVARSVIPQSIPLVSAVENWGNSSALIAGLFLDDLDLIGRALQDNIFEPKRAQLVKGFDQIKSAALKSGALGCSLSGSGPSIFALCRSMDSANEVAKSMQEACENQDVSCDVYLSNINHQGACILESE